MAKTIVDWKTISSFVTDAFVGVGVPREDAEICTDVLLESDRRGIESHGVNRFKPIYIDRINIGIQNPVTNFEIVKETPTTAVIDGHDGMGQVIGYKSMKMAIDKAKKYGLGMVAVRNSCHYGIAGYYATMATKENMIGITGTNARPSIAPTFGVENMLGTNLLPLACLRMRIFRLCSTALPPSPSAASWSIIPALGSLRQRAWSSAATAQQKQIRMRSSRSSTPAKRRWLPSAASVKRWPVTRATAMPQC